jgi:hypothetical protein
MIAKIKAKLNFIESSWKTERVFMWIWAVFSVVFMAIGEWQLAISHVIMAIYAKELMDLRKEKLGK